MSIKVNPLPYSFDALEPYISKKSLELHYTKYYQAYTEKINHLIKGTSFEGLELEEIILKSASIESDMFNNAAQSWNQDFYNERMNYLSGFWQIINWNFVEDNLLKSRPFKPSAGDKFMDGGASSDYLA